MLCDCQCLVVLYINLAIVKSIEDTVLLIVKVPVVSTDLIFPQKCSL